MAKHDVSEIRVFAPATVANVACGYDVPGFVIDAPCDEVLVRHSDIPGLRITKITGDAVAKVFASVPLPNQIYISKINPRGVHVVPSAK